MNVFETHPRLRLWWYSLTIFLSSGMLMVLEITAGRLLAPFIGVSLYTWTSIIGVVLAGLSLGNWIGGIWVDRGGSERAVGLTLTIGGASSLLLLLLLKGVAIWLENSSMGLLTLSFIYVFCLFFIPAALLGIVTPMLTTLALQLDSHVGHIVGRMHALAALGSIVGTFLTGYWLVQTFGTRNIILGTGVLLVLMALPFFHHRPRQMAFMLFLGLAAMPLTLLSGAARSPCDVESNYFCIRVVNESASAPYGEARGMVLDHLVHGASHKDEPRLLLFPYVELMDKLIHENLSARNIDKPRLFYAGGGAYTQPRAAAARYPNAEITVAELDPHVTRMATEQLYFEPGNTNIIHKDARLVMAGWPKNSIDVVVGDVFHQDISIPYHLVTREYFRTIKTRLSNDGLYVMNAVDTFPNPALVKSIMRTLAQDFEHVHVWLDSIPDKPQRMTYVITASDRASQQELVHSSSPFQRRWLRVTEPLLASGTPLEQLPILSDDYVPVERLISSILVTEIGH
ncbi:MAG: fused MFS/spermidine synthase [Acidiferrobacterales bacterium]